MGRCSVIGVLDNGFSGLAEHQQQLIVNADLVIAGSRLLTLLSGNLKDETERRDMTGKFSQLPQWIDDAIDSSRSVVVLATGDPLCHGIGSYLVSKLGLEKCEIIPNISTLQVACSRFGLAWQSASICSIHGADTGEWIEESGPDHGLYKLLQKIRAEQLLIIFTSSANSPDRVARMMLMEGFTDGWQMAVAENLLQGGENLVGPAPVVDGAEQKFSDMNIMLLWRDASVAGDSVKYPTFGLEDSAYSQRKPGRGLITKREVRALALARMQLSADSVVWDIGAGSGSVGLEAARVASSGHVYAIEKNEADADNVRENRKRLQITNYTLVVDKAPSGISGWPDPNAVFIGGSGGNLGLLVREILQRMRSGGWLVMNFVTKENLAEATEVLKQEDAEWDVTQLQASRSSPILEMHRMEAENPVWIVSARKQQDSK